MRNDTIRPQSGIIHQKAPAIAYFFVLALEDYESSKDSTNIEVPDLLAEIEIVQRFQEEIRQIAEHKWNKSQEAGRDIGRKQAIEDWLQKHQALWFEAKERIAKEPAGG